MRSKRHLVQSREFSAVTAAQQWPGFPVTDAEQRPGFPMLKKALNAYHNRAIATQEDIEEQAKHDTLAVGT